MRLLHTADWHLGRTLDGFSREEEQVAFIDEIVEMATDTKVDFVLISGDVFDTQNPSAQAERLFYYALEGLTQKAGATVVVIAGNHDNPDRIQAPQNLAKRAGIYLLGEANWNTLKLVGPHSKEQLNLLPLPYISEARLGRVLASEFKESALQKGYDNLMSEIFSQTAQSFSPDGVNIIAAHLLVLGSEASESERPLAIGGAYRINADLFPESAQYVALGHMHRPQVINGHEKIRYAGSPLIYSLSEIGQAKSVTLLEVKKGQAATTKELFLSSGRPVVKWQSKSLAEVQAYMDEGRDKEAYLYLELDVGRVLTRDEIQHLKSLYPRLVNIQVILPEMKQEEVRLSGLSLEEIFRRFYVKENGTEPSDDLVDLFINTAAKLQEGEGEEAI